MDTAFKFDHFFFSQACLILNFKNRCKMQKKKNVFALLTSKFERSGDKKFERTFKRKIRKKCFIAKFFSFEKETDLSVNKALKTNRIINK